MENLFKEHIDGLIELFNTAKTKTNGKPLQNKTRLMGEYKGGVLKALAIKHHETNILTFDIDSGKLTLFNGGWFSITTKSRINDYLPSFKYNDGKYTHLIRLNLIQKNRVWFLELNERLTDNTDKDYIFTADITHYSIPYENFMIIKPDFSVDPNSIEQNNDKENRVKDMSLKIKTYVNGFINDIKTNGLEAPSGGDCWGCCMVDDSGKTVMGDDHLLNHIDDKYYVPSLLYNSLKEMGYNAGLIYQLMMDGKALDIGRKALNKYFVKRINDLV